MEMEDSWQKSNSVKKQLFVKNHFSDHEIILSDIIPGKDGQPDIVISQERMKLKAGDVPCIFKDLLSYLSSTLVSFRESPDSKKKETVSKK